MSYVSTFCFSSFLCYDVHLQQFTFSSSYRLVYLFGDDLINALTLIDDKRIYLVRSDSGRQVFKVLSQDKPIHYICYKNAYYCTCLAFKHKGLLHLISDLIIGIKFHFKLTISLTSIYLLSIFLIFPVISSDSIMCKHLIATRIADAMGLIEIENINDQQMADLLK